MCYICLFVACMLMLMCVLTLYLYHRVQRTVKADSVSTSSSSTAKKAAGSLDKVLSDIKGPQAISTVTKSSYDWENFKEEENLEDDLSKATKDGYVCFVLFYFILFYFVLYCVSNAMYYNMYLCYVWVHAGI